jgi:hypothetical protein
VPALEGIALRELGVVGGGSIMGLSLEELAAAWGPAA